MLAGGLLSLRLGSSCTTGASVGRSYAYLGYMSGVIRLGHLAEELFQRAVLRSSDQQIGPGHNSLFEGPGGQTYICYHAWDKGHTGRYAWVAPLEWDKDFPLAGGVSSTDL